MYEPRAARRVAHSVHEDPVRIVAEPVGGVIEILIAAGEGRVPRMEARPGLWNDRQRVAQAPVGRDPGDRVDPRAGPHVVAEQRAVGLPGDLTGAPVADAVGVIDKQISTRHRLARLDVRVGLTADHAIQHGDADGGL